MSIRTFPRRAALQGFVRLRCVRQGVPEQRQAMVGSDGQGAVDERCLDRLKGTPLGLLAHGEGDQELVADVVGHVLADRQGDVRAAVIGVHRDAPVGGHDRGIDAGVPRR
jgi:hypothetical protein